MPATSFGTRDVCFHFANTDYQLTNLHTFRFL